MYTAHLEPNRPFKDQQPGLPALKGVTMDTSPRRNRRDTSASRATVHVARNGRIIGSAVAVSAMLMVGGAATATPAAGALPTCHGKAATIVGTRHADRIIGTPRGDVIVARAGSDRVIGRGGADLICGGSGNDQLDAGNGTDHLFGGPGSDVLRDTTGSSVDQLRGGPGADLLRSRGNIYGSTTRTLVGGAGADRIVSSGDGDRLRGRAGDDHLVARDLYEGRPLSMTGNQGQDIVRVPSSGGRVRLRGDGDSVRVDFAADTFVRLSYFHAAGPVMVDLRAGYGQVVGSTVKDHFIGLTDQPDSLLVVKGTNGDDILLGTDFTGTTDVFDGRRGDDQLRGRDGADSLFGRPGDDLLDGGAGSDTGSGGSGADTCIDVEDVLGC